MMILTYFTHNYSIHTYVHFHIYLYMYTHGFTLVYIQQLIHSILTLPLPHTCSMLHYLMQLIHFFIFVYAFFFDILGVFISASLLCTSFTVFVFHRINNRVWGHLLVSVHWLRRWSVIHWGGLYSWKDHKMGNLQRWLRVRLKGPCGGRPSATWAHRME